MDKEIDTSKINQEEYEVLKELDDKWKWIARDKNRCLYVFTGKPVKKYGPLLYWGTEGFLSFELFDEKHLFQFIQWEDEEPHNIAELIEEYESEETEVKDMKWFKKKLDDIECNTPTLWSHNSIWMLNRIHELIDQLDEPEQPKITLQDVTHRLWEIPLNSRTYWLARLNDEFQEGYIVPLGLKTTDGEEQYLTYNGSYFASRRNKYLQQTFATLEEIPEFYRGLAERVL